MPSNFNDSVYPGSSSRSELTTLDGYMKTNAETGAAILFSENGDFDKASCWLPKSQIEFTMGKPATFTGVRHVQVTLPVWLAQKEDLV